MLTHSDHKVTDVATSLEETTVIEVPQEETASSFRIFPDWEDGDYELELVAHTGGQAERLLRSVRLNRSWKLMLSTDKPVYQPGQTIHARSLALRRPDLNPGSTVGR